MRIFAVSRQGPSMTTPASCLRRASVGNNSPVSALRLPWESMTRTSSCSASLSALMTVRKSSWQVTVCARPMSLRPVLIGRMAGSTALRSLLASHMHAVSRRDRRRLISSKSIKLTSYFIFFFNCLPIDQDLIVFVPGETILLSGQVRVPFLSGVPSAYRLLR